ncbi:MAG: protein kinase [Candidatus Eisenbacteria bacterium]|nr:protein kinase [Candidatus Eisenbacteria bacterium]
MIGKTISHYRILEKLGEGGMGIVYKAQDTKLDRVVALKLLPPEFTLDTEAKKRLIQEARAASTLNHPNISTIYEIGEAGDATFITMECVEGGSLTDKIHSGMLSLDEAIGISLQVAEGLQEAHDKGIVHRDIKSENIIVTTKGKVKIIDFGVAKLLRGSEHAETGQRIGTGAYMSPEQLRGEEVDHRADIWSFGVVLYEVFTGHLPFEAEYEQALTYSILHTDPKPISTFRPDFPEMMEHIVRKALQKNKNDRYQSVGALIADLTAVSRRKALLAVLPFEDISPGRDNEYFSDGLAEELILNLSRLKNVQVTSRTTTMQYKGTKKDSKTIGKELGVRYILEGSVRKFRNDLRITAQLVDVEADAQLWTGKYGGTLEEVFDIQEQVSEQIVDALMVKLSPTEKLVLAKRPTQNAEAFDYNLRARNALYRMTKNDVKSAIELFARAIELDSHYAAAHAGLGEAYAHLYANFERKESHLDKAVEACLKALMYDETLSEAYAALGMAYFDKRMFDEALMAVKKAIEFDPGSFIAYWIRGRIYHITDRDREAIEPYKKAVELNPDYYVVHMDLRTVYERLGEMDNYAAAVKAELEVYPRYLSRFPQDPRAHVFYAVALARAGRNEEGKAEAAKAIELNPTDPLMLYNTACFYARIGEKRLALDTLKHALRAGFGEYEWLARDPDLDSVRGEPEYTELMKRK